MFLLWTVLVAGHAAPQSQTVDTGVNTMSWLDAVVLALGQDGTSRVDTEVDPVFERLCRDGHAPACTWDAWRDHDNLDARQEAAGAALAPHCEADDAVSCLVEGWVL